ncbi:MAG: hypothetical protein ABIC91_07930 [Nanoarchaeota archaeon]|nr:VCBS repeat-containing protein [Nanoarchaeota archaeon]MBU1030634.1 VCBS repeat-containing protein [Nanoarchaeota archaeon]MBU1849364.1 VCBS repeat-containing protein [Nanoarchaeota archaeon]
MNNISTTKAAKDDNKMKKSRIYGLLFAGITSILLSGCDIYPVSGDGARHADFNNDGLTDKIVVEEKNNGTFIGIEYGVKSTGKKPRFNNITTILPSKVLMEIQLRDYDKNGWPDIALITYDKAYGPQMLNPKKIWYNTGNAWEIATFSTAKPRKS